MKRSRLCLRLRLPASARLPLQRHLPEAADLLANSDARGDDRVASQRWAPPCPASILVPEFGHALRTGMQARTAMASDTSDAAAMLDSVIRARRSVRAFRPDPVPRHLLVEILETARAAPSNFNSQPWRVYLLTGNDKQALGAAILQAHIANSVPAFSPFPRPAPPDCAARVEDFAQRLYASLGIDRADMAARARQTGRNFVFFDAPVGLIFTIHAALTRHSWLDYGLF